MTDELYFEPRGSYSTNPFNEEEIAFNDSNYIPTVYKSRLLVAGELRFGFERCLPNWWWRFWQWVFFGFRWEKGDD